MASVKAVCVSEIKGVQKKPVESVRLIEEHGIEGDAHAGEWHKQVALLASESVARMQEKITIKLKPGDFGENVLTEGIDLMRLPVGSRIRLGTAELEITQIGKECHQDCAIRKAAGDCVMPREGVFARVLNGGEVRPGDGITVM